MNNNRSIGLFAFENDFKSELNLTVNRKSSFNYILPHMEISSVVASAVVEGVSDMVYGELQWLEQMSRMNKYIKKGKI
jgi:hypothetical protein